MSATGANVSTNSLRRSIVRFGVASRFVALHQVIAEVKRRSPSKGALALDLDLRALAAIYRDAGANAISVLTDRGILWGFLEDLIVVRRTVAFPVLRKDFTVSENDILDAAEAGASAVLLIVAALSDVEFVFVLGLAERCGIDALVEVHDAEEAQRAVDAGAKIIGINQRDLRTFDVDPERAASVIEFCRVIFWRSVSRGCPMSRTRRDAAEVGFDAVLVGEAFVTASDPGYRREVLCAGAEDPACVRRGAGDTSKSAASRR